MYRSTSPRPYIRSSLARAVYERMQLDEQMKNFNKATWYECNLDRLPSDLCDSFVLLDWDSETQAFIDNCYEKADWFFTQLYHTVVRSILSWFMTQTSINSWLQRGSMFVFSKKQFVTLLQVVVPHSSTSTSTSTPTWRTGALLDLGAGDGNVTAVMAPFFESVHVTEASSGMRTLLAQKGYNILELDTWDEGEQRYDVIAFLNLLDRCDRPSSMLQRAKAILTPDTGRIVVALALPFLPYVEEGSSGDHRPTEALPISGDTFEDQVASAASLVFRPAGFEVERWTRSPYLCEGDLHQSFYWLQDAIFVLKPAEVVVVVT